MGTVGGTFLCFSKKKLDLEETYGKLLEMLSGKGDRKERALEETGRLQMDMNPQRRIGGGASMWTRRPEPCQSKT
jgi:hypothetical protein